MNGRRLTSTSQAEHVRQAAAEDAYGPAEASQPGRLRRRRKWAGKILDLHEVRANGSDPLELLRDLVHRVGQSGIAGTVELLGQKNVFGDLHRVLQEPVDEDHVDPDQFSPFLDGLRRDLADVRDELQLQLTRLSAPVAGARVGRDQVPFGMEGSVHGDRSLGGRGDRDIAVQDVSITREEGGVTLDLDEIEAARRVDHLLEQPSSGRLSVGEAGPVKAHVLGVAADVGDQSSARPGSMPRDPRRTEWIFRN